MGARVETTSGQLEGIQHGGHQTYLGIPYAAPPTGERRFKAPAKAEPWSGVRRADAFGPSAPQPINGGVLPVGPQSEDCLYLNVYTPAADGTARPVMFFIHGGAFFLGAAAEATYDGGPLCERGDVVVVTINYRLGALAYAYLDDRGGRAWGATPNAGMLDQVAALQWVRDNIAAFGGNPDDVTIFGQSAGAFAVATLLAMPAAKGLFKRAILQSGHANMVGDRDTATSTTTRLLEALGLDQAPPDGLQAALQSLPVERILEAQAGIIASNLRAFAPVVDGTILPARPIDAVRAGEAAGIPILIGTTRDEVKLYIDPKRNEIDDATMLRWATRILPRASQTQVANAIEVYRQSRMALGLPHGNNDIVDALGTAGRFRIPALRLAEAQAAHQPAVFAYEFTWPSPAWRGAMGSVHALELPFVFGTVGRAMQRLTGDGPELVPLSERMMDAWLAFARTGDPSCDALGQWPPFEPQTRATMIFDGDTRVELAPLEAERRVWTALLAR